MDGTSEAGASPPPIDVRQALRDLDHLDLAALRAEWQKLFRAAVPTAFSRDLLQRDIAYRLQEIAFGGLPRNVVRRLIQAAEPESAARKKKPPVMPRLRPGVTLVREWHGTTHTVQVVDGGFEHQNQRFGSLTEIARHITGARWSGPRFFGLQRAASASPSASNPGRAAHG